MVTLGQVNNQPAGSRAAPITSSHGGARSLDTALASSTGGYVPESRGSSASNELFQVIPGQRAEKSNSDSAFFARIKSEEFVYSRPASRSSREVGGASQSAGASNGPDSVSQSTATASSSASNAQALSDAQVRVVQQLKNRDREVRAHEAAHAAVGGGHASAPTFT